MHGRGNSKPFLYTLAASSLSVPPPVKYMYTRTQHKRITVTREISPLSSSPELPNAKEREREEAELFRLYKLSVGWGYYCGWLDETEREREGRARLERCPETY